MRAVSSDYDTIRAMLRRGEKLTVDDVVRICGRDRTKAQVLLGNLKMTDYARVVGKVGRQAVYVAGDRLLDEGAAGGDAHTPGLKGAAEQGEQMTEAMRRLMRAMRIGFPPKNSTLKARQVYGRSGLHAGIDPEDAAA